MKKIFQTTHFFLFSFFSIIPVLLSVSTYTQARVLYSGEMCSQANGQQYLLPCVSVSIANQEYKLLVNTGQFYTDIKKELIDTLGSEAGLVNTLDYTGQPAQRLLYDFPGINLNSSYALPNDQPVTQNRYRHTGTDGIIGFNQMNNLVWDLNFEDRSLSVLDQINDSDSSFDIILKIQRSSDIDQHQLPAIQADLARTAYPFILEMIEPEIVQIQTGWPLDVLKKKYAINSEPANQAPVSRGLSEIGFLHKYGGRYPLLDGFDTLSFGDYVFTGLPELYEGTRHHIAKLFFDRQRRVVIDLVQNRLFIKTYGEPDIFRVHQCLP